MSNRRGFTLTEILVAMAIFAFGGAAIVSLFFTNVRLSRQAMDYTRAAEISRNVRSLLRSAVSRPIPIGGGNAIYRFEYPGTSLRLRPEIVREIETSETTSRDPYAAVSGSINDNAIYFSLPTRRFDASVRLNTDRRNDMITRLPNDSLTAAGLEKVWPEGARPHVFRFRPDGLRAAGVIVGVDRDDRVAYTFDFEIRRSTMRSGAVEEGGQLKLPLEDLYVVHVRVYKGYEFPEEHGGEEVENPPLFEWDFYVTATR